MGGAFFILRYYVAVWLKAVTGGSAPSSCISPLPMVLDLTIGLSIAGQTQQYVNYIPPYTMVSAILALTEVGLFLTWTLHTAGAAWISELGLFGIGQDLGWQQPFSIPQVFLPEKDLRVEATLMSGYELSSGAIFLLVGSSVRSQHHTSNLKAIGKELNMSAVVAAGATRLASEVPPALLQQAKDA